MVNYETMKFDYKMSEYLLGYKLYFISFKINFVC